MTCQVDANPPVTSVRWQKNGVDVPGSDFVLTFSPATREDAANYSCVAANDVTTDTPVTETIRVHVVYPPVVTLPRVQSVPHGARLDVTCSVHANPHPFQVVWEKVLPDGRRRAVSMTPRLEISKVTREDAGNYSCRASNLLKVTGQSRAEAASGEAFVQVHVLYAPGNATIVGLPDNVDVGDKLTLSCLVSPLGYPLPQFRWRRNGAEQQERGATISLARARLADSGEYSCQPHNSVGNGKMTSLIINVNGEY